MYKVVFIIFYKILYLVFFKTMVEILHLPYLSIGRGEIIL